MGGRAARAAVILCLAGAAAAGPAAAQEMTPGATDGGGRIEREAVDPPDGRIAPVNTRDKQVAATEVHPTHIQLDGSLQDAAWQRAEWFSDFLQKEPEQGALPSERTEVAFVYTDGDLYVGARMYHSDPEALAAYMTRRDEAGKAEQLIVSFDTYRDRRTAYTFAVTAAGVRLDWYHPEDYEYRRDRTWDPVWEAETRIDSLGWTAEMRIPFSQLRFNDLAEQEWGVNVNRWIPTRNEDLYWIYVPRDETGWSSWMGTLTGLGDIDSGSRIELSPYLASDSRVTSAELVDPDDPFHGTTEFNYRAGADFKMGLGPNLTLDATVNPDFGQVEADPAVVNLSAFETIFDERRPFFTEGARLLQGRGNMPTYYFSRRIGSAPSGLVEADFADVPDVTTILGAAKLTGRLGSGLSVGALGALTDAEHARTYDASADAFGETRVEPTTGWGVLRLQQEFGADASTVGFTLTGVRRDLAAGRDDLPELLHRQAYTGGGDFNLRFADGMYELRGHAGFSYVEGEPEAIERTQRSSTHYFQRPDQDHVTLDPTRTSLLGLSGSLQFARQSGEHWLYNAGIWADSPNWELNDVGQLFNADDIQSWANLRYRETEPAGMLRSWSVGLNGGIGWNFGGVRKDGRVGLNAFGQFANYWQANVFANYFPRAQNPTLTRGGPLMGREAFGSVGFGLGNNFSSATRWRVDAFWGNQGEGDDWNLSLDLEFEPTDRMRFSVSPLFSRFTNRRQYYTTLERESARTFGARYVFATVERSTISTRLRANYAFTPDLNLELYAEPFVSTGRFSQFGELPAARAFGLRTYGTDGTAISEQRDPETDEVTGWEVTDGAESFTLGRRDFAFLSFRSNMVLRWELVPGSTLFVVWQQNRSESRRTADYATTGDLFDTFGAPGANILALKLNYWLPL